MQSSRYRVTLRRMMVVVAMTSIASYIAFEPFPPQSLVVNVLVGAVVSVAYGIGAARHAWIFLAIGLFLWNCVPLIDHGENARSLCVRGSLWGFLVGAPVGWYLRARSGREKPHQHATKDAGAKA